MDFKNDQTEFTQQQINGLIANAMLYEVSSRREQIAAQFVSALLSNGEYYNTTSLGWDGVADNLVESAVSLTDKLIIRLEKDK